MSDHPTEKVIRTTNGTITITVDQHGYPFWTRMEIEAAGVDSFAALGHEEARDLLYAMQRIVAYLDKKTGL